MQQIWVVTKDEEIAASVHSGLTKNDECSRGLDCGLDHRFGQISALQGGLACRPGIYSRPAPPGDESPGYKPNPAEAGCSRFGLPIGRNDDRGLDCHCHDDASDRPAALIVDLETVDPEASSFLPYYKESCPDVAQGTESYHVEIVSENKIVFTAIQGPIKVWLQFDPTYFQEVPSYHQVTAEPFFKNRGSVWITLRKTLQISIGFQIKNPAAGSRVGKGTVVHLTLQPPLE